MREKERERRESERERERERASKALKVERWNPHLIQVCLTFS